VEHVPEIAPVLIVGGVTGMRRGELVSIRRSRVHAGQGRITVDTAVAGLRVKTTKTRTVRDVAVDSATLAMLSIHNAEMDERAALFGVDIAHDPVRLQPRAGLFAADAC
jgi:integrase